MGKSTVSVPISARPALTPPKGVTAKTPTFVINTSTQPRSPRRWAFRHPDRIEVGGGALFPKIKCSRKDIGVAVLAIGAAPALVYGAKSVYEYFKNLWTRKAEESHDKASLYLRSFAQMTSLFRSGIVLGCEL